MANTKEKAKTKAKKTDPNVRLVAEMAEMADGMFAVGIIDNATHAKITKREMKASQLVASAAPIEGETIRALRENARLSQAVFAEYLNLSVGYVSKLERGAARPDGSTLALLNVIRRKGIEAIL
jgi:putative transcriptional regulator